MFTRQKFYLPVLALFVVLAIVYWGAGASSEAALNVVIPKQSDWVDHGPILGGGLPGEWDHLLWGAFTGTAVKTNGSYFLYYQGARDYLDAPYYTVVWRAIGVATSQDGINFTKYSGNPVVTWFPSGYPDGYGEEGATSGAVTLDDNGDIILYYGASTAFNSLNVHADGRLATSGNGFDFTDLGVVLPHDDSSFWGWGDELYPIAVIQDGDQWIVYYLPNGSGVGRNLGVAWGASPSNLTNSAAVKSGESNVGAWGMAGQAKVGPDTYAIFTNWVSDPRTEVRLMSPDAPDSLSAPVEVYRFDEVRQATILLDQESETWFMYYRSGGYYGVKTASAKPIPTETPEPTNTPTATATLIPPTTTPATATPEPLTTTPEPGDVDPLVYLSLILSNGRDAADDGADFYSCSARFQSNIIACSTQQN